MSNIHNTILDLCNERGIKPIKMSKDIGLSRSFMTELKSGRTKKPSAETLKKIAFYFGVTTDYLLGSPGEPDPRDIPPEPEISDSQLMFALWGDVKDELTADDLEDVKKYADMVRLRKLAQKKEDE